MSEVLELMRNCEKVGVKIAANGQKLKIDAPTNLSDSMKDALRRHKADIIRILTKGALPTMRERLNRMIAAGTSFDVSADDFQAINVNQTLNTSDKEFLKLNSAVIVCHLQQSLLVKHLFSHSPEQFEDFAFEIRERECLSSPLRITDKTRFEIYVEAVKSTTRKWFEGLLEIGETNK